MFDSPIGSIMGQIQRIGAANTPRRTSTGGGDGVFGAVAGAIPEIMANEPDGSVLSQYYRGQQQGKRIPGYQGNVSDMRTTAPDGRSAYVDDYGNMYYMDTGERVETREIPEDLSQPMVGPNSAYGPYYEFGPNGPYDTRNINDPRHPDNPNNRQVPEVEPYEKVRPERTITNDELKQMMQDSVTLRYLNEELYAKTGQTYNTIQEAQRAKEAEAELAADDGGYPAPTREELREMVQQAQALREANDARTAAAEAELAADPSNTYTQPQVQPLPQVTPYPQVEPLPQAPTQSAGYLRSTGEGGYGAPAYYNEINAYLANHSPEEIQQAMGTYGVSQEDVDAARAYQPQYARGGLSRMLRKVR